MKVREVNCSDADVLSARIMFDALAGMYDLHKAKVLDAFARNGQLTVSSYVDYLKDPRAQLEVWELGAEHLQDLLEFTENVKIGDSYGHLKVCDSLYDLVVIDTPQGMHRDGTGTVWAEHFGFLQQVLPHVTRGGVVVLYVNKEPYDKNQVGSHGYDEYEEYDFAQWMDIRRRYYGSKIITEEEALAAYRKHLAANGRTLGRVLSVPCFSDVPHKPPYAFRLALEVL